MRKHSRLSKYCGFKEVFLNPNDKGSGNHAQGAFRGRTVLKLVLQARVISSKIIILIEILFSELLLRFFYNKKLSRIRNFHQKCPFEFSSGIFAIFDRKRGFQEYSK